jgi:hypothetical protein
MTDLLGYLLKIDEPDERQRIEELLRNDSAVARELAVLRRALEPLEADNEAPAPASDLVARTIGRIAEHVCANGVVKVGTNGPPMEELMARLTPEKWKHVIAALDRAEAPPSRWRRADFVVLASVIVVGFGLVLAALPHLRHRQNLTTCQNNLRQLYQALDAYADVHQDHYPQITDEPPHNTAASFVSELREAGMLPDDPGPGCPAGPGYFATYAYTLGYRDDAGNLQGLRRDPKLPAWDSLPIAADRPAMGRTSPNPDHLNGQNVLFAGGNVRFCTSANVGVDGDDIYRNLSGEPRAGQKLFDTVLGVGGDRP